MKRDALYAIVAILVVVGVTYGIASVRPPLPPPKARPYSVTTGQKGDANVVMRVNGEPVTEAEFHMIVQMQPEQMQAVLASPAGRKQLAEKIVEMKALEQEAEKLGAVNDAEVKSRMAFVRSNIMAQYAIQKLASEKPDEQRIRAEYEKERARLSSMELSHILIATQGSQVPPKNGRALTPEQATEKASMLVRQLRTGASFADVARNESDDLGSAAQGGSLGQYSPGGMPPELDAVVSRLKAGEISDPVRSPYGVHIFKAGAQTTRPYEQVKDGLAERVQQQQITDVVNRLTKSAKVEYDPKFFSTANAPGPPRKTGT